MNKEDIEPLLQQPPTLDIFLFNIKLIKFLLNGLTKVENEKLLGNEIQKLSENPHLTQFVLGVKGLF